MEQLDIFEHTRGLMLKNDVLAALRRRDALEGHRTLKVLAGEFPDDGVIKPMETLLVTLANVVTRFSAADRCAEAIHHMETVVIPAATLVFDNHEAIAWLAPVWQALAKSAEGLPFDNDRPNTHAAWLYLIAGFWAQSKIQTASIPSWHRNSETLAWMAEAAYGEGGLDAAWCQLAELAWIDAPKFGTLARRLKTDAILQKLLDDFDGGFKSEDPSYLAWFPAFLLIEIPALISILREARTRGNTAPERTARLIMELLSLEKQGRHADVIAQRKRLRDYHGGLFSRYMSTR